MCNFFTYQNLFSLSKKNHMTSENLSGKYFYADKPIFISRMDKATIISVIQDVVQMNEIECALLKLNQGV